MNKSFLVQLRKIYHRIVKIFFNCIYYLRFHLKTKEKSYSGLNDKKREIKLIVSLTSFPGRISIVHKTIQTLLSQREIKPDLVELWLAESQFPQKEKELPKSLTKLKKYGLSIRWCEDLRSYKKLIPALSEHPNDVIVTVDDDVLYKPAWLKYLYTEYLAHPEMIHCHRATQYYFDNNTLKMVGGVLLL